MGKSLSRRVIRIWRQAWEEFTPFLRFPPELRKVVYTTNVVESVHYQLRKVTKTTGAFPNRPIRSQAAAPRRQKHNQQTRRKPRHRHPRLENSPKPTRNPLPQPTKPNPLKTHEPRPSHRRFDKPYYRGGDPVTIRIDPDHMLYHCGQHKKTSLSCGNWASASQGANRDGRTVMSHTPCGWTSF